MCESVYLDNRAAVLVYPIRTDVTSSRLQLICHISLFHDDNRIVRFFYPFQYYHRECVLWIHPAMRVMLRVNANTSVSRISQEYTTFKESRMESS
jgi:hypothetical protein